MLKKAVLENKSHSLDDSSNPPDAVRDAMFLQLSLQKSCRSTCVHSRPDYRRPSRRGSGSQFRTPRRGRRAAPCPSMPLQMMARMPTSQPSAVPGLNVEAGDGAAARERLDALGQVARAAADCCTAMAAVWPLLAQRAKCVHLHAAPY